MDQDDKPRLVTDGGEEHGNDNGERHAGHENGHDEGTEHVDHSREHQNWTFDPLFPPRPEDRPERPDVESEEGAAPDEYTAIYESICGATDDSQPVELYDGTLGVTKAFVDNHERPVGQLQWNDDLASKYQNPGNVSGVRWATGTLISENLFLTAGHNFDQVGGGWVRPRIDGTLNIIPPDEIATNMHVNFNFQVAPDGTPRTEQEFAVEELVEYRLDELDYAIVRLAGSPGNTFGTQDVAADDAEEGDMLCIIGHPAGQPKRIEAGPAFHLHDARIGYDDIDTLGGNSGSGILNSEGEIVGVHTNGGCDAIRSGHNHGVRISSIRAASQTIRNLSIRIPTLPRFDNLPTLPRFDDPPTSPVLDRLPTSPWFDDPPTSPFIDHRKLAGLDNPPGLDPRIDPAPFRMTGGHSRPLSSSQAGSRPFALATPHHASMGVHASADQSQMASRDEYEAALEQLEAQYRQVLMEYEQLVQVTTG